MTILVSMKAARLQARKDRNSDKAATLGTLISDIEMVGKNAGRDTTNSEAIAVLKKFIKNAQESLRVASEYADTEAMTRCRNELSVFNEFLPKQMTNEELTAAMTSLAAELQAVTIKDRGVLLKTFKDRFDGTYDGATAATVAAEILKA